MKKALSLALVFVLIFALAVPAMAGSAATGPDTATLEGVGFHCNHGGNGNGKTDVVQIKDAGDDFIFDSSKYVDAKGKVLKGVAADTGTKFKFDFVRVDETTWKLVSEEYYCIVCGNNLWASFSNNSGVPNGKNIQVNLYTPPAPPEEEDDNTVYGLLSIQKTVGDVDFGKWAADNGIDAGAVIAGMKFTAYLLDADGNRVVPEKSYPGDINLDGVITFLNLSGESDDPYDLPIGWYEVVEEISGAAMNYFVGEGGTQVYYVGEDGVSSDVQNFVSGREGIGEIVAHDGNGVNWQLPKVWDDFFTTGGANAESKANYSKLMEMGAQWIWDVEDTYLYGIDGSAITLKSNFTLGEDITVPLYYAADNVALIYVDGVLVAYTDVALAGKNINIGDEYIGVDALGEKGFGDFDGRWTEGWNYAYKADIELTAGAHEIIIIAANSASTGYIDGNGAFVPGTTGTDNDGYNYTNNPCGLIFGFEIPAVTFDNTPIEEQDVYGDVTVNVDFDVKQDTVIYEPIYERTIESASIITVSDTFAINPNSGKESNFTYVELAVGNDEEFGLKIAGKGGEVLNIGYKVSFVDDQLVISFDEDMKNVSIYADILDANAHWNNNGNHTLLAAGETITLTVPKDTDSVNLYVHISDVTWDDGITFKDWKEVSRVTNDVAADVTELTVELWLGEDCVASMGLDDLDLNNNVTLCSLENLEDGEYTIKVFGVANGAAFNEERTITITDHVVEDIPEGDSVDFTFVIELADIEIKDLI